MDKIIPFQKPENICLTNIEALKIKLYANAKLNNISQELVMNIDKMLNDNGWEFKTAADRDFIANQLLLNTIQQMSNYIQIKRR